MVNSIFSRWADQLLPRHCILCDRATSRAIDLCIDCEQDLPSLTPPYCDLCALPLSIRDNLSPPALIQRCGRCLKSPPSYQSSSAGWLYRYPVDQLISQFKHQAKMSHGRVLAELFSQSIIRNYQHQELPDLITPTPLHWQRLWLRGFNQSDILAQRLSKLLNIPIQRTLKRSRHTHSQQGLTAKQRHKNLNKAFTVRSNNVKDKTIALVDDVVTTGTTADQISQCLLAAGAKSVHIWCLARTPIDNYYP